MKTRLMLVAAACVSFGRFDYSPSASRWRGAKADPEQARALVKAAGSRQRPRRISAARRSRAEDSRGERST